MNEEILIIENYVPDSVCKELCELTDESEENKGERQFIRGKDLHTMELDFKKQMSTSKGKKWQTNALRIRKAVDLAYLKWCEKNNTKPYKETYLEVPKLHRYDAQFGKHVSTLYKPARLMSAFFYLNDVKGSVIKINDQAIKTKRGMGIFFPATKDFKFSDNSGTDYMKYVIKTYNCKK